MLGCGSSGSSTGQIRFVQASPGQPLLNLLVDGKSQASNLDYGNATAYLTVRPGSRHVQAVPVSGGSAVFDVSVPITSSKNTTVLMTGPTSGVKSVVLSDGGTTAVTGDGFVRVLNASVSMGPADVYIVAAGTSLSGLKPVSANVGFDQNGGYQQVAAGDYEVFLTTPGTQTVLLDTGPINLTANQNWTLLVLDGTSGGFTFTTMQDQ
jgi:hypothetical protein